ncbi:MAG: nuclear transport factor 2 family protein [Myxococcales bacterium]|nr:nuclear transport factor 2 family protein [Myxococcales bacterium]
MLIAALCLQAVAQDLPTEAPTEAAPAAPPPVSEEQLHEELREVRAALLSALAGRDIDGLVATVHPNIVLTTTTGEVARGGDGIRGYAERMLVGEEALIEEFDFDVQSDELSIFHNGGNTAIAWGPSLDTYTFSDGSEIALDTRWSATLVRDDGAWQIVAVHSSLPAFDNVLLNEAQRWLAIAGGGGLAVGGVGGLILGFLLGRRR